ncbi:MAG: hypothetical protein J6X44_05475, partial [Thermoguttaceae bacterium]|nr:hypothetical protein [Thermoguttaceae bacterium]
MKNNSAHDEWEEEKRRAIAFFIKFQNSLDDVRKELEKRAFNPDNFFANLDEWKDTPVNDVFIDDILKYADNQKGKTLLEALEEIQNTGKTQQKEISKLSDNQQAIARKRIKELEELVDRGQRMKDAGYTPEYTDKVMRLTYDMCKDGLREVAAEIDLAGLEKPNLFPKDFVTVFDPDFKKKKDDVIIEQGWFNSDNGFTKQLGNKTFTSLTEYIASKTTPEAFNTIESANAWHGVGSYTEPACYRKYAILKSMGYDVAPYKSWSKVSKDLSDAGFFINDRGQNMRDIFHEILASPQNLNPYYEGQAAFDAATQVVLENMKCTGIDSKSRSMILLRTEDTNVLPKDNGNVIEGNLSSAGFRPGVCESHGHITASFIGSPRFDDKTLTVVRVPFSRVHSLWFMERGEIDSSGAYSKMPFRLFGQDDDGDFQFWAYHQNEIDACTQGLPIINVGDISKITNSREEAETTLKN